MRNFLLGLVIYGALVVIYLLVVLRFLGDWLIGIFNNDLALYAAFALGLVVAQGVLLEFVTSFRLVLLNVERLE